MKRMFQKSFSLQELCNTTCQRYARCLGTIDLAEGTHTHCLTSDMTSCFLAHSQRGCAAATVVIVIIVGSIERLGVIKRMSPRCLIHSSKMLRGGARFALARCEFNEEPHIIDAEWRARFLIGTPMSLRRTMTCMYAVGYDRHHGKTHRHIFSRQFLPASKASKIKSDPSLVLTTLCTSEDQFP